jgi:hypothetical protein
MTLFENYFRQWTKSACLEWGFPEPGEDFFSAARARLPLGVCTLLAEGIAQGIIIPAGRVFSLKGLAAGKGPYAWFSRYNAERRPNPNWEYYVQAAQFVRLSRLSSILDFTVNFEDDLMDLAIYRNKALVAYIEVKERASELERLVTDIRSHEGAIDFSVPDRGNDALRKAKYLVRRRPTFFCGIAVGARFDYHVDYPAGKAFELVPDLVPWA